MQSILITGGAGFLGRAYLRWAAENRPHWRFTIMSRDEGKHARCRREFPDCRYVIGDVRDEHTLDLVVAGHDAVIHAAAFKYVPQGETNVSECLEINTIGSRNVARACVRHRVDHVVGISTDKACSPINVYGQTKLLMERLFQEYDAKSDTRFHLVRYGNVVSSTGSVIPIFRQQLRDRGFVTVTDPQMTRFWLRVDEAVALINRAFDETTGGTVLIPRLPSMSMEQLAHIAMRDFPAEKGAFMQITGERFGEKRHESLLNEVEARYTEAIVRPADEDCDVDVMRLHPTFKPFEGAAYGKPYSSDAPDRWLEDDDMLAMIQGAPE